MVGRLVTYYIVYTYENHSRVQQLSGFSEREIKAIVRGKKLSEAEIMSLMQVEQNGRDRKMVRRMLSKEVQNAKRRRALKQAERGILLPTV